MKKRSMDEKKKKRSKQKEIDLKRRRMWHLIVKKDVPRVRPISSFLVWVLVVLVVCVCVEGGGGGGYIAYWCMVLAYLCTFCAHVHKRTGSVNLYILQQKLTRSRPIFRQIRAVLSNICFWRFLKNFCEMPSGLSLSMSNPVIFLQMSPTLRMWRVCLELNFWPFFFFFCG